MTGTNTIITPCLWGYFCFLLTDSVKIYALNQYGLELLIDVDNMSILEAYVYIHEDDCIDDDDNCFQVSNEF